MTVKNRRVFELRLGKVGLILFISGISVLLFSIFLLGIVVGKHMEAYPERYASGIPDLIREHVFAALPKSEIDIPVMNDESSRDDGLALGPDAGGAVSGDPIGEKKKASPGRPSTAVREKSHEMSVEGPTAEGSRAVSGSAGIGASPSVPGEGRASRRDLPPKGEPQSEGSEKKRPKDETKRQRYGLYEVQVAAYREMRQAEQLVKKFADFGFTFRVVVIDLPGKGRWFRVIAGGFESREMAREAADRMAEKVSGVKGIVRPVDGDGRPSE